MVLIKSKVVLETVECWQNSLIIINKSQMTGVEKKQNSLILELRINLTAVLCDQSHVSEYVQNRFKSEESLLGINPWFLDFRAYCEFMNC